MLTGNNIAKQSKAETIGTMAELFRGLARKLANPPLPNRTKKLFLLKAQPINTLFISLTIPPSAPS